MGLVFVSPSPVSCLCTNLLVVVAAPVVPSTSRCIIAVVARKHTVCTRSEVAAKYAFCAGRWCKYRRMYLVYMQQCAQCSNFSVFPLFDGAPPRSQLPRDSANRFLRAQRPLNNNGAPFLVAAVAWGLLSLSTYNATCMLLHGITPVGNGPFVSLPSV